MTIFLYIRLCISLPLVNNLPQQGRGKLNSFACSAQLYSTCSTDMDLLLPPEACIVFLLNIFLKNPVWNFYWLFYFSLTIHTHTHHTLIILSDSLRSFTIASPLLSYECLVTHWVLPRLFMWLWILVISLVSPKLKTLKTMTPSFPESVSN